MCCGGGQEFKLPPANDGILETPSQNDETKNEISKTISKPATELKVL